MATPNALTVEDRLARMQALLRGAWCASTGDEYRDDDGNSETVRALTRMAMDEVTALAGLDAGVLNVECSDKPPS